LEYFSVGISKKQLLVAFKVIFKLALLSEIEVVSLNCRWVGIAYVLWLELALQ
jgi:hypothetical protein